MHGFYILGVWPCGRISKISCTWPNDCSWPDSKRWLGTGLIAAQPYIVVRAFLHIRYGPGTYATVYGKYVLFSMRNGAAPQ